MKLLYHISEVENIDSILENGLRANEDGCVYLFEDALFNKFTVDINTMKTQFIPTSVADDIAKTQLFLKKYAKFVVDVDELILEADNVAEQCANYHYVYYGSIPKDRINLDGVFEVK